MSSLPVLARIAAIESRFTSAHSGPRGVGGTLGTRSARADRVAEATESAADSTASAGSFAAALAEAGARVPTGGAAPTTSIDWSATGDAVPAGTPYAELFTAAAQRAGLPPRLLAAVAQVESGFDTTAVSPAGAQGLMQFMPGTSSAMGVDPWDPASAIDGAARLLAGHRERFGSIEVALAAYNLGSGTVSRAGGVVPPQGRAYVDKVLRYATGGPS